MATNDLTTLANVKAWLGKTDASSDAVLSFMITQISDEIRTFTNRDIFPVTTYAEVRDGNDRAVMTLLQYPLVAVSGVSINGVTIPAIVTAGGVGYAFDKNSIRLNGYRFTKGVQNVAITYTAGYAVLPAAIESACMQLVAYRFEGRNRIGTQSKSQGQQNTTFKTASMPESVTCVLKQWSRPYPG